MRGCADKGIYTEGARKMVEAAELALETLAERDQLLVTVTEERGTSSKVMMTEEPEEMSKDDAQA